MLASACGRRRVVVQSPPPAAQAQPISSGGQAVAPAYGGQVLALGQELYCQFGSVRLQVLANGQLWVDGLMTEAATRLVVG